MIETLESIYFGLIKNVQKKKKDENQKQHCHNRCKNSIKIKIIFLLIKGFTIL
jgi:hypothetical protein